MIILFLLWFSFCRALYYLSVLSKQESLHAAAGTLPAGFPPYFGCCRRGVTVIPMVTVNDRIIV